MLELSDSTRRLGGAGNRALGMGMLGTHARSLGSRVRDWAAVPDTPVLCLTSPRIMQVAWQRPTFSGALAAASHQSLSKSQLSHLSIIFVKKQTVLWSSGVRWQVFW